MRLLLLLLLFSSSAHAAFTSALATSAPPYTPPTAEGPYTGPERSPQTTNLSGSLSGQFSVGNMGTAEYSLPLTEFSTLMEELDISFEYASGNKTDLLGEGWKIAGLSRIHRCFANKETHAFNGGINFDANDRFCIDGQPLIAINGLDGIDGTEYRTEINDFSRVISYGSTGNGPQYFKIWKKTGEVLEYGNTPDSLINPPLVDGTQQADATHWLLNSVVNKDNDIALFGYQEDDTTGEFYPLYVSFIPDGSLLATSTLDFIVEERGDAIKSFIGGRKLVQNKRIAQVQYKEDGLLVSSTTFYYKNNQHTNATLLTDIQTCDATNVCTLPTTFAWDESRNGDYEHWTNHSNARGKTDSYSHHFGDVNGDGLNDWVQSSGTTNSIGLATGQGSYEHWSSSHTGGGVHFLTDVSGDGLMDGVRVSGGTGLVALANGQGGLDPWITATAGLGTHTFWTQKIRGSLFADVNGDGMSDWIRFKTSESGASIYVALATGGGNFNFWSTQTNNIASFNTTAYANFYLADVNGDRMSDLIVLYSSAMIGYVPKLRVALATGDGNFEIWSKTLDPKGVHRDYSISFSDINGDGMADWITTDRLNHGGWVALAAGDGGFEQWSNYTNSRAAGSPEWEFYRVRPALSEYRHQFVDANGDGRSDWVQTFFGGNSGWVGLAKTDGDFIHWNNESSARRTVLNYKNYFADTNGDGMDDWIQVARGSNNGWVGLAQGEGPLYIIGIDDGAINTTIDYKPLTDSSVYTKGTGAVYPEKDVQDARYVAAQVVTDDSVNQTTLGYIYSGAKEHQLGRGFLGFESSTVTDPATNTVTATTYRQDFPFIGEIATKETTVDGQLVERETNTYETIQELGTTLLFPYTSKSLIEVFDPFTSSLSETIETDTFYDLWGNITEQTIIRNITGGDTIINSVQNVYVPTEDGLFTGLLVSTSLTEETISPDDPLKVETVDIELQRPNLTSPVTVTLTTDTDGAQIYYTLDDSTPSVTSTLYAAPFTVTEVATLRAIGIKDGYADSKIVSIGIDGAILYDENLDPDLPPTPGDTIDTSGLVASLPGGFSVGAGGGGNYGIAVDVPPGTAGVAPQVSINYSSNGDDGIMGLGWSLGGLSVIHRCPANLARDGYIHGIDFSEKDRFCMDGAALVAIDGEYGADGTEYRTEYDSFSKIVSYGNTGNGPEYFKVWTKSGEIIEYGNTADSRINPPFADGTTQPDAICWLVNKISDTAANYIRFTYFEDEQTGGNHPLRIEYTGNENEGTLPDKVIEFVTEDRPDVMTRYVAGRVLPAGKRLTKINVINNGITVADYNFAYSQSSLGGQTLLDSIQKCVGVECISPTTFTYSQRGDGELMNVSSIAKYVGNSTTRAGADLSRVQYGDFNGDGILDIYIIRGSGSTLPGYIYFGNGDGTFSDTVSMQGISMYVHYKAKYVGIDVGRVKFQDFNGDGYTDIYYITGWDSSPQDRVYMNDTQGGFLPYVNTGISHYIDDDAVRYQRDYDRLKFGDFNGDSFLDVYMVRGSRGYAIDYVYLGNGDGTFSSPISSGINTAVIPDKDSGRGTRGDINDVNRVFMGEFNGDGLTDVYYFRGQSDSAPEDYVYLSNGDGTFKRVNSKVFIYKSYKERYFGLDLARIKFADFNGDGLTDVYENSRSGDGWGADRIRFSRGDGTFTSPVTTNFTTLSENDWDDGTSDFNRVMFGDFNGDGKSDVYYVRGNGSSTIDHIYISNGDGSFLPAIDGAKTYIGHDDSGVNLSRIRILDLNGDSIADIHKINGWGSSPASNALIQKSKRIMMTAITNSVGVTIAMDHKRINDPTADVYTKGTGNHGMLDVVDVISPMYVVSQTRTDNGISGQTVLDYGYSEARTHIKGRGFLGFAKRTVTDPSTNTVIETNYNQPFPHTGMATVTTTRVNDIEISREQNTFAAIGDSTSGPVFPYIISSTATTCEYNLGIINDTCISTASHAVSTVTTDNTYDLFGNPTDILITTNDHGIGTYTTHTVNTYTNDTTKWHLGRLTHAQVDKTGGAGPGGTNTFPTRVSTFAYDVNTGFLTTETIEPGSAFELTKTYAYDGFGNQISVTTSGAGITSRTTSTTFDAQGLYPVSTTNALSHTETYEYNDPWGGRTKLTGPNGLVTQWQYDTLGRQIREIRADGTESSVSYAFCEGNCPLPVNGQAPIYTQTTTSTQSPTKIEYYDAVNRVVLASTQSFNGDLIYIQTEFDEQGRTKRTSQPYYLGAAYWTDYAYDDLGRTIEEASPVTGISTMAFNGLQTTTTNALGQTGVEQKNSMGWTLWTKDPDNNQTDFSYDPQGNLIQVDDPQGNSTTNTYNLIGQRIAMSDPDMGDWTYSYNALGELVSQTDAKSQTTAMVYDVLGRMISRTEPEGTTTWSYDTATMGVGKLASVAQYGGYDRVHSYDALGRPSTTTTTIAGTNYTTSTTYDALGRVDELTYPTGFKVKQHYTSLSYLERVSNDADTQTYWTANAQDEYGNLTSATLGNGLLQLKDFEDNSGRLSYVNTGLTLVQDLRYEYNAIGNLTKRKDERQNLEETFAYDNLNRITSSTIAGQGTKSYQYDSLGNITQKDDVGSYSYGENGAGPHAVTSTTLAGQTTTYTYDANGNQISSSDGRSITYSSYNKPTLIQRGANQSSFDYGPERARYKQTSVDSSVTTVTTYIGSLYEQVLKDGITTDKHYIKAGNQTVAIYQDRSNGTEDTRYLHRDHLGSVDAITDETGNVVERLSFDAFGKKRQVNWQDALGAITSTITRGYTGHEQLDNVGLIHMNGRVYDPTLARFLSADPFIQFPKNLQSLNRYSYVLNNPLSLTDPSGFFSLKKALKKIGIAAAAAFAPVIAISTAAAVPVLRELAKVPLLNTAIQIGGCALLGGPGPACSAFLAAYNGLQSYAVTGSFTQGIKSAAISYATAEAFAYVGGNSGEGTWQNIAGNAAVGGISAELQGGNFAQGAIGAGFGAAFKPTNFKLWGRAADFGSRVARTATAAIIGGTASAISGGKFANGAVSAAFSHALNGEGGIGEDENGYVRRTKEELSSRMEVVEVDNLSRQGVVGKVVGAAVDVLGALKNGLSIEEGQLYYRRVVTKVDRATYYNKYNQESGHVDTSEPYEVVDTSGTDIPGYQFEPNKSVGGVYGVYKSNTTVTIIGGVPVGDLP